jgi:hypothetical protein
MGPGIHDRADPAKDMQSDNFPTMSALTDSRVKVKGCDQRRVVPQVTHRVEQFHTRGPGTMLFISEPNSGFPSKEYEPKMCQVNLESEVFPTLVSAESLCVLRYRVELALCSQG